MRKKVLAMEGRISSLTLLCLVLSGVGALNVNIPQEIYEYARGDNITLPCSFTPAKPLTAGKLVIISWSVEAAQANAKETLILTYYSSGTTDIKSVYEGRVSVDVDIPSGKADLKLSSITLADNKFFECRVQIPGDDEGKPADTARLVVLVAPSKPICKIQGKTEYGQNINLTCVSEEGSPPPTYKWESRDVRDVPRVPDPRTTDKGGILSLYNISRETSGFYICTSSNKIRSATCNITVAVMPRERNLPFSLTIWEFSISQKYIFTIIYYNINCSFILPTCLQSCSFHEHWLHCRNHCRSCCLFDHTHHHHLLLLPKHLTVVCPPSRVREEEYHDKEPAVETRRADGQDDIPADRRDRYEERSERSYDHRKDYDDRRSDYDDRRSDYNDRRSDYDDRRSDYNDRRSDYDDRRSDYDDRRDRYSDRNERYDDNRHYDDERRYNDRRDRGNDDDRYDEPYDDRNHDKPSVPANKPPRRDYDD